MYTAYASWPSFEKLPCHWTMTAFLKWEWDDRKQHASCGGSLGQNRSAGARWSGPELLKAFGKSSIPCQNWSFWNMLPELVVIWTKFVTNLV